MSNNSIRPVDRTLLAATTLGQIGPRSNDNERVLNIPQSSSITRDSPSDCIRIISITVVWKGDLIHQQRCGRRILQPPGPVLDFGPERGPGKGTMADLGPLIRHLVSTRLPSGGRAAFLSPLSPMHGTRPSV